MEIKFDYFKALKNTLKYIPVAADFFLCLHVLLLLFGKNETYCEYLFGYSLVGVVLMMLQSYALKFCNIYRAFVLHDFLVYTCIYYERWVGFGEFLLFARLFVLLLGVCVFGWLFSSLKAYNNC